MTWCLWLLALTPKISCAFLMTFLFQLVYNRQPPPPYSIHEVHNKICTSLGIVRRRHPKPQYTRLSTTSPRDEKKNMVVQYFIFRITTNRQTTSLRRTTLSSLAATQNRSVQPSPQSPSLPT